MSHGTAATAVWLIAASLLLFEPAARASGDPTHGPSEPADPSDARPAGPDDEAVVSAAGASLAAFLDSMEVEKHWLAGHHVDWRTGEPDGRPVGPEGVHSHCSAFVAAASSRLGVPILEPPEHPQTLLASAQCRWLGKQGSAVGWYAVPSGLEAQRRANAGELVVACTRSVDAGEPGHIAIVRPAPSTALRIATRGPQVIQAGARNWNSTSLRRGFEHHRWAWAHGRIEYFAHTTSPLPREAHANGP